ncbi:CbtA family protein [Caulobacter endophyticus]|uniref:CbtA family protein n=1 Tax=Caulobacter endophyticus TaxID=2172652 RepID=UPI0024108BDB|nr:CbtA family protein [Caulobacter endophyticus]MDG2527919.1 CbtA family protein [Caulobacter endophyticus]
MTPRLLWRGMLAGVIAALLAFVFARFLAEPQIDLAIAYEAAHARAGAPAHPGMAHAPEPELVSRATQKGLGLLTALALYGAATGGIFALVFAYAYGRWAKLSPRALALVLAGAAFVVIALVPALKYPPTPPAVGQHETVVLRTIAFFLMIALSVIGALVAHSLGRRLRPRLGALNAALIGAAAYLVLIALAQVLLPAINETPADFPAVVLWNYRVASIGMQAVLWLVVGLVFGSLAKRTLSHGRA